MLVDSHLHVWRASEAYPYPTSTTVSSYSDVPIEVWHQYMHEHSIDRAVLVQPVYPGEDNSYVADCAASDPDRLAAVCVVNPSKPDAADKLEYWACERGCKGLRLRPRVPGESAVFGDPNTYRLWERARDLNLVVSLLADSGHLPAVASLAERFPDVAIVIDHMAHPDVTAGVDAPLFHALLELARYPRVYVKVSGYYYFSRQAYPYADCWELFHALYDQFGSTRLIWGSDFPHVLLKSGYLRCLRLPKRSFPFLTAADLDLIMGSNAAELYWPG